MAYNFYRLFLFLSLQLNWLLFGKNWAVDVVFLVYPGTDEDYKAYGPKWLLKGYLPLVFPIGWINRKTGLVVACAISTEEFERDPTLLRRVKDKLEHLAKGVGAKSIAIAGRLPSIMERHGVTLEEPFVHGTMGTVFAIDETVRMLIEAHQELSASETTVAVIGVGYTGRQLMERWARNGFKHVIGYDILDRSAELSAQIGEAMHRVTFSTDPAVLARADMVVILVEEGHQIAPLVQHIRAGAMVLDDTHPQLPSSIRLAFEKADVDVYKVAMEQTGTRMRPRLPGYRDGWLPGCVVEALVTANHGGFATDRHDLFAQRARETHLLALRVRNRYESGGR